MLPRRAPRRSAWAKRAGTSPDRSTHGVRSHDGGRLRQHPRAAPPAAHPAPRSQSCRCRDADDAVPAGSIGRADRVRTPGGPLAAAPADNGRPRCLSVSIEFRWTGHYRAEACCDPGHRRARRGGVPPAGRRAGAQAGGQSSRIRDVGLHHRGHPRVFTRPLDVRAVCPAIRARLDAASRAARAARGGFFPVASAPDRDPSRQQWRTADAAPVRQASRSALPHRRIQNDDGDRDRYFCACHADATWNDSRGGRRVGSRLLTGERRRRILRRSRRGPVRSQAGHCLVAGPLDAVPDCRSVSTRRRVCDRSCDRRILSAIDAAGQRDLRSGAGPGERRDRLIIDDGLCVGNRWSYGSADGLRR